MHCTPPNSREAHLRRRMPLIIHCMYSLLVLTWLEVAHSSSESRECFDSVLSSDESDVDCGGTSSGCQRCVTGRRCRVSSDCAGGVSIEHADSAVSCTVVSWGPGDSSAVCLDERSSSQTFDSAIPQHAFLAIKLLVRGVDLGWCGPTLVAALRECVALQLNALGVTPSISADSVIIDRITDSAALSGVTVADTSTGLFPVRRELMSALARGSASPVCMGAAAAVEILLRVDIASLPLGDLIAPSEAAAKIATLLNEVAGSAALCEAVAVATAAEIPVQCRQPALVNAYLISSTSSVVALSTQPVVLRVPQTRERVADDTTLSPTATCSASVTSSLAPAVAASTANDSSASAPLVASRTVIIAVLAVFGICGAALYTCLCAVDMRVGPSCGVRIHWMATLCGMCPLQSGLQVQGSRETKRNSLLLTPPLASLRADLSGVDECAAGLQTVSTENPIGAARHSVRASVLPRPSGDARMLSAAVRAAAASDCRDARHGPNSLLDASFRTHAFRPSSLGDALISAPLEQSSDDAVLISVDPVLVRGSKSKGPVIA